MLMYAQGIDWKKVVIKMDTEGAERDILRQLKPFIAKYKPSMLLSMVGSRVRASCESCADAFVSSDVYRCFLRLLHPVVFLAFAARVCVPSG